jgi:tRNA G37 N-methylase Trm5
LESIESKFRTFPLEVIGGDPCLDIDLKEGPARFQFNFAQVGALVYHE